MTRGLTEKQERILSFIVDYVNDKGYPPSIREIGNHFEISSLRGVTVHLDALERKGYIKRKNTARAITVIGKTGSTSPNRTVAFVPLVGTIAAGIPILASENVECQVPVPQEMVHNISGAFALRVKGESMIGDHIMPNDLVVIRQQVTAENDDLVAARIGDEATVKRYRKTADKVLLLPSNPAFEPIEITTEDSGIIGRVIGLIRNYDGALTF
jgi:repressor LexA